MQKLLFSICLLFLIIGAFYYIAKISTNSDSNYTKQLKVGEKVFLINTVSTAALKSLGLSYTKKICDNCGMLFVFEEADYHSFWMKDMNYDLDIVFIDQDKNISEVFKNVKKENFPEKIQNKNIAQYVLEINSGAFDKYDLNIGDKLEF
jgi:uncharacterized membrane protein (UPF0127 family)